jgi:type III restriction enzyme
MTQTTPLATIQKRPDICGGQARIRQTRIPVWTLVSFRQQGASDEELLRNYPGLNSQDLAAAWSYYSENSAEIESIIAQDND